MIKAEERLHLDVKDDAGRFATTPIADRLERHWMPEPNSGCWLWLASVNVAGYGVIRDEHKKYRLAHRLSYIVAHGPIPDGLIVLHRCDVPSCINPGHLSVGTDADNQRDKTLKGRAARKLTPSAALSIKRDSRSYHVIAAEHDVSYCTIDDIKRGRTWRHV